jgi:CRISPR/Cas system-associated exonuclease Cas4 (RecB family)
MRNGYATTTGDVYLHVAVAEAALGKKLPKGAVVHHVDLNPLNNDASNLVVCPSQSYHLLLHATR